MYFINERESVLTAEQLLLVVFVIKMLLQSGTGAVFGKSSLKHSKSYPIKKQREHS